MANLNVLSQKKWEKRLPNSSQTDYRWWFFPGTLAICNWAWIWQTIVKKSKISSKVLCWYTRLSISFIIQNWLVTILTECGKNFIIAVIANFCRYLADDLNLILCCWWLIWPIQNDAKILKNDWNLGTWVLIWEYSARAIQWIPTWQVLDGFQKLLRPCALDESSLSIGRVKPYTNQHNHQGFFLFRLHRTWSLVAKKHGSLLRNSPPLKGWR